MVVSGGPPAQPPRECPRLPKDALMGSQHLVHCLLSPNRVSTAPHQCSDGEPTPCALLALSLVMLTSQPCAAMPFVSIGLPLKIPTKLGRQGDYMKLK